MLQASSQATAWITEVVKANQHWQDMIEQAAASRQMFAETARIHDSWKRTFKPIQDQMAELQAAAKLTLASMAYRLTVSERLLAGPNLEAIRRALAPPEPAFLKAWASVAEMTASYRSLAESIRTYPDIMELPVFALPGATRELFAAGHGIRVFRKPGEAVQEPDSSQIELVTEVERETSVCIELLQSIDPALATTYLGAHEALPGRNPDRARHVLSSLRELWNHLLRRIAPDERVLAWVPSSNTDLVHEGRPTRRARVLYVCRNLNHPPLAAFIDQDTRALVRFVEFFNRVHALRQELTDEQLRALLLRTDSWISYILQVWGRPE